MWKAHVVGVALLAAAIALPARAQVERELSAAQRTVVEDGGQVFLTWNVAGSPWPRACVFEYIDATPEEAAAAFTNYARQREYIPGLRRARVSRVVDATTVEVDYTLDVPIVADEDYTVRDHLSSYDGGASYRVDWTLVRATSTKATDGAVRFEPHHIDRSGRDGTLMAYCNLVVPGSRLAGLSFIRSRALAQLREAAHAVVVETVRQRTRDRALLDAEIRTLRDALAGASVVQGSGVRDQGSGARRKERRRRAAVPNA